MAATDIIARLKLSATNFSSELTRELGGVERKFGNTGSVIGRNLSQGIGSGLQDVSARIPVVGSALAGLSGPALVAAGAIGAVGLAMGKGVADADEYMKAVKGLDAVLTATGNNTGFSKQQLVEFAEETESSFAIAAEEIINAEKVLTSFDGVAGSTFKRAITGAADMAAVYGGDLASNAQKVGIALQNLAQGNVEGLGKAFKFLGTDTLETIKNLAELGRTADAQALLLDKLEQKVGGAAASQAQGLSGAYYRLADALGDANREFVVQSGLYQGTVDGIDNVTAGVNGLITKVRELGGLKGIVTEVMAALASPYGYATNPQYRESFRRQAGVSTGQRTAQGLDEDPYGLNRVAGSYDDLIARRSAEKAYANRKNDPEADKKAKEAGRESEKRALEEKRIADQLAKQTAESEHQIEVQKLRAQGLEYEADLSDALFRLYQQFPGIDKQRLANLVQLTNQQVAFNSAVAAQKDLEAGAKNAQRVSRRANDELERFYEEQSRRAHEQINDLADFYESAMSKGSGSIWKQFKAEGKRVIAEIAAAYTLALISGQKPSFESIIGSLGGNGSVFSGSGGGLLGSLSKLLGGGGGGGGAGGDDLHSWLGKNDIVAGDGTGIGSAGGLGGISGTLGTAAGGAAIGAGVAGLGKMLGLDTSSTGGAIGGTIGSFVPIPGGNIIGSIVGSLVGGLFKKHKVGSANLTGTDSITYSGNSGSRKDTAEGLAGNVIDQLQSIADALGGTVGSFNTSIGVSGDSYHVDTTGQGRLRKSQGGQDFNQDAEAAVAAAVADAVSDGAITGISEASKRILQAGKDLQQSIEKAALIESVPKQLKALKDPLGAAVDDLNSEFEKIIKALNEGGATAQQRAEAEELYNLRLLDVQKQYADGAAATLKQFRDALNFGSSSPLSLRDQEASAGAALQPFIDQINSGKAIDQQAYQEAAQAFLDIERELYGSTDKFFSQFAAVQNATNKAIANIDKVQPIAESPFAKATADATAATADILTQQNQILTDLPEQIANRLSAMLKLSGGAGFIGSARAFV